MGNAKGYTLVEVVVSTLVVAMMAAPIMSTALAGGPGDGMDGWVLPGDLSGLDALQGGHHELDLALWAPALASDGGRISYDVTTTRTPSGPQPDVTFRVSWGTP